MSEIRRRIGQGGGADAVAAATSATEAGGAPRGGQAAEKEVDPPAPPSLPLGRTPSGRVFPVHETPDMISSIFRPDEPKTPLDLLTLASLVGQVAAFALLRRETAWWFFLCYFAFWRASYNIGLGVLLTKQSKTQWIVRVVERLAARPRMRTWMRAQVLTKMGRAYPYDEMPIEYNTWLLFRSLVDVVLLNDVTAYVLFGVLNFQLGTSAALLALRWAAGVLLLLFNLWVKLDAHRVVKDYAWYWGDCFFLCQQSLVFDGVYEVAPDPMYSIGYAGYYGLSLLTGSYMVLFVSLAAHASQLGFLVFFENPHMDRTYGTREPLSRRTGAHDLHFRLFHNDNVLFSHVDPFRATDFLLVLVTAYALALALPRPGVYTLFAHALLWRVFHSFGLGHALRAQSEHQWLVRHFVKHYHYASEREAIVDAFANWKVVYNASLVLTYVSFGVLAVRAYSSSAGGAVLRYVLGVLLILLHMWSARSSFRVLGLFGWQYGDFFVREYPQRLQYTGIYRFLNNPERTMGGAAFFGMALISGSALVGVAALVAFAAHWWFLSCVEGPHMRRVYGAGAVRGDSGVTRQVKGAAARSGLAAALAHPAVEEVHTSIRAAHDATLGAVDTLRPRVARLVRDTRTLLEAHGTRLLHMRTGDGERELDVARFSVRALASPLTDTPRFYVGEPIPAAWTAPANHSPRDWIGMFPVGAHTASVNGLDVTCTPSRGRWLGVAESAAREEGGIVSGLSVFAGHRVYWAPGRYELRYHHDGSYDVLARSEPFEVYADAGDMRYPAVHAALARIVAFALAADVPHDRRDCVEPPAGGDIAIWTREQVRHITDAVRAVFGVDFGADVVLADANVGALARHIVEARELLG